MAICTGVSRLHAYGFVHRDLKPANVMYRLGADGADEPVLVDFGLATPVHIGSPRNVSRTLVDGKLVVSGTPGYVAPELLTGGDITAAADIHALGVIASKCFSSGIPFGCRGVVNRAMSSAPGFRYSSISEFSVALSRAFRARLWLGLSILLALIGLLVAALGTWTLGSERFLGKAEQEFARPDAETEPEAYACWFIETLLENARREHRNQVGGRFTLHNPIPLPDLGLQHKRFFELSDAVRSKYEPLIEALKNEIEADAQAGKCGRPIFYNYIPDFRQNMIK